MPPRTRYARAGDVHIAYQVVGDGPRDVVFVPGFVSNVDDWWEEPTCVRFFERLASFARLIVFDKRGTGLSDRLADMPTLEERADDILAALDAAGSSVVTIFGVSDGGALATLFAASHPERTSALVLYGTIAAFISWFPTAEELGSFLRLVDEVTVEAGRYLARHIPGAQYVELPGTDHLPWVGNSEAILAEVEEFLTGTRPAIEPERMLATVLVASIPGAAPLALRLGDRRWLDLLERFRVLASREIARYRGRELSLSGEDLVVSFDGPARAVRCAEAISQAMAPLGANVQAGLHTGEIELAGGAGVAVQIASWIAELACAGEILVSSTVKDLVAGSGLRFQDRGLCTLPGAPDQWRLYTLEGAVLAAPAARQAPPDLTAREREVAAIVARGLINRQIGEALAISEGTAALHVKRILATLGFSSRAQIAAWAVAQRMAPAEDIQI